MSKRKIRFIGLLTYADSSILNVRLEHGFKFDEIGALELIEFIMKFEKIPEINARTRVTSEKSYVNLKNGKGYIITNLIDGFEVNKAGELDNKGTVNSIV